MASLKTHLNLARLSNAPTIASNVFAALAICGVAAWDNSYTLLVTTLVLFYTSGMYLNDYFDAEHDREKQKFRPIPSGVITRRQVGIIGGVLLGLSLASLLFYGLLSFGYGVVLAVCILLYNVFHKKYIWSVFFMALSRYLVYIIAAVSAILNHHIVIPASLLFLYVLGLTWIARNEDRYIGLNFFAILCLFAPVFFTGTEVFSSDFEPLRLIIPLIVALWILWCFVNVKRDKMRLGIGGLIAGISLVDALFVSSFGGSSLFIYLCLGMFVLTLIAQKYIRGT